MIVGIDLGTTNSLISIWQNDEPTIIPNVYQSNLTPSVVGLDDDGNILVGSPAKNRLLTHPQLTAANFKRFMGTDKEYKFGKKKFRAEELSAFVLRSLKSDAEAFLGEKITEAVITVPAYFNDTQRKATKIAGQLAGLKVDRLLNEPTAAAMAYGLQNRDIDSKFLVFDLGGGTFDISILELFDDIMEVHASAGDNFLGGEDFTHHIAKDIEAMVKTEMQLSKQDNLPLMLHHRILAQAEIAKKTLSKEELATLEFSYEQQIFQYKIDREKFQKLTDDSIQKIIRPIQRALRDAKIRSSELDEVVLVGGATRMPIIRQMASKLFKRIPATHINPDEVIVTGAAVQSALLSKAEALNEVVMTDVCPYTMGIEVTQGDVNNYSDGHYMPIIERNSFIPISKVDRVFTLADNQKHLEVRVFQGENPMVKDNIFLGKLIVKVPKNKAGEEAADIRFTYDINGLLEIQVTIISTDETSKLIIEENPGVLSKKEIAERFKLLEKYKVHPRDQLANINLVTHLERLYQESLGEQRQYIGDLLARFNQTLNKQDAKLIEIARKELNEILANIESDFSRF